MSMLPHCETLGSEAGAIHTQPTHALTQSTQKLMRTPLNVDGKGREAQSEDRHLPENSMGDRQPWGDSEE